MLNLQTPSFWNLMPIKAYRFLEKEHIDSFMSEGILQLSSYKKFKTHLDEIRGDKEEGKKMYFANYKPSGDEKGEGYSFFTDVHTGSNAYVLSLTMKNDISAFEKHCKYDAGFLIKDVFKFAYEIGRGLTHLAHGVLGQCIYTQGGMIEIDLGKFNINDLTKQEQADKMNDFIRRTDNDNQIFFVKDKSHEPEQEYRIMFFMDEDIEQDTVKVKCPKANFFCDRIL
jgi:hypothetical protein